MFAGRRCGGAFPILSTVVLASAAACAGPRGTTQVEPACGPDAFDELQENVWYLPTADGKASLYVTELGHGPMVVVLHGGPGNDFNYLVDAVRPHAGEYRFVLFDQRGSLLSPVPEEQTSEITLETLVADLETLRRALGEEKLVLFGHSFGTVLANAYYRAHPDRVAGLVLAASFPPGTTPGKTVMDDLAAIRPRIEALRERPAVAEELRRAGGEDDATASPRSRSLRRRIRLASFSLWHVERWGRMQGGDVYYNPKVDDAIGNSLPPTFDLTPTLAARPVPITVIQGDHDYLDPGASRWVALASSAPSVHVDVIAGASHYAWIDNPSEFEQALARALDRVTER